jgi:hypothetical protein
VSLLPLPPSFVPSSAVVAAPPAGPGEGCLSGAHSLSSFGSHLYPDTGNGGYTSFHTDVFLDYDTATNMFLPGTHVVLTTSRLSA